MSLLLKSLKQIDWRPAEAPAEEVMIDLASATPVVEDADETPPDVVAELEYPEETPPAAEPPPIEPEAIELPPPPEPEIQSAETTLERLNALHDLIDAALEGFSQAQPLVVQPAEADPAISPPAIAAEEAEEFEPTIAFSPVEASPATVVPPPVAATPIAPLPLVPARAATTAPWSGTPAIKIRDEYRELRDHLLARFPLDEPSTLLAIDAGRVTNDAAWLVPFAACLLEALSEEPTLRLDGPTKILLVEAAGSECGIARHLGLDCPLGLAEVLQEKIGLASAIQPTWHPQIELLGCGRGAIQARQSEQLRDVWSDLEKRYQVILVAAGPWEAVSQAAWRKTGMATAAAMLPLADAAVLCVELDGTPQGVAVETKQALERRGIRLLGCVVNGPEAGRRR